MSYRDISFAPSEYYHVYNRGNSKQKIFIDAADYQRFQDLLFLSNDTNPVSLRDARRTARGVYGIERKEHLVAIGAYSLMPNHFHILLTTTVENGVSDFVQKVSTGYAMYFNKRHHRTGSLFEGKFKARHVDTDEYLKYLFSYIHLNPLKIRYPEWKEHVHSSIELLNEAKVFPFSSYQDYVHDMRNEAMILHKERFPDYFNDPASWDREMMEWITYGELFPEARPREKGGG